MDEVRGKDVSMIFQDPMTSLNPVLTVGEQIAEVIRTTMKAAPRRRPWSEAGEMLELVGIPGDRARRISPPVLRRHEAAGGHRHRPGLQSRSC